MSGECYKCGEHCLDCKCGIGCDAPGSKIKKYSLKPVESIPIQPRTSLGIDRSTNRFFYKGKFFQNEDEFWKFAEDWPFMNTDQETFYREWEHLGKEIWMNIGLRGQEISNGALNEILQENFLLLLQKFFGK